MHEHNISIVSYELMLTLPQDEDLAPMSGAQPDISGCIGTVKFRFPQAPQQPLFKSSSRSSAKRFHCNQVIMSLTHQFQPCIRINMDDYEADEREIRGKFIATIQ